MANKIALLVNVQLITRVIVDEEATDEQIAEASKKGLIAKIENNEIVENMVIVPDEECPFGSIEPVDYRSGDVHDFLLDCELITTDGMEIVIEKCAELLPPNDEVEIQIDKKEVVINVVSHSPFSEKKILETVRYDLNKINGFCKDCINDFDNKQMCRFCKGGNHRTEVQ